MEEHGTAYKTGGRIEERIGNMASYRRSNTYLRIMEIAVFLLVAIVFAGCDSASTKSGLGKMAGSGTAAGSETTRR